MLSLKEVLVECLLLKKRGYRFLYQIITRGWDDSELWNLDMTMAQFILPRFRVFHTSYPDDSVTDEEFELIEFFLEKTSNCDHLSLTGKDKDKFEKVNKLFGERFCSLWN